MTDRPILFSGEMVNAIREGRKTQTRRVITPQPGPECNSFEKGLVNAAWRSGFVDVKCPYNVDRLWVRERQRVIEITNDVSQAIRVRYEADGYESGWIEYPQRLKGKPVVGKCLSYGGYRESSRLTLEVTSVGVERLQDISEEDARAEGATTDEWVAANAPFRSHRARFRLLWNELNEKRPGCSWAENPWVWCVSFGRAT